MPFSTAQAGRGHAIFRNVVIIKYHFHKSVETQPKKVCVSTPCFYNLLKISASKNQLWPRPAGNFGDAYLARTIDILLIIHYLCEKVTL